MIVLGIDPAFRNFGWVIYDSVHESVFLESAGVFCPPKRTGKNTRKLAKGHADLLDVAELSTQLRDVVKKWQDIMEFNPDQEGFVASESPTGSMSARSAKCIGYAQGIVVSTVMAMTGKAPFSVTPEEARNAIDDRFDSKKEVVAWARESVAGFSESTVGIVEGKMEHVADAVAVAKAAIRLRAAMGF